jgi:hypothetical protein
LAESIIRLQLHNGIEPPPAKLDFIHSTGIGALTVQAIDRHGFTFFKYRLFHLIFKNPNAKSKPQVFIDNASHTNG